MHGRQSEESLRQRHMVPVPVLGTIVCDSLFSFTKDGRKISIGDCALFQAGNAPPFIGIIRSLSEDKERKVKLAVNWLYRPTDVKLGKGVSLEAAPNEVFYSFHRDEIYAASLLHPCKVAFLRKGVELPAGVSSFVCRRVYDTTTRRLWWLTDQDYTDERQEEVNKLLDKTRLEMHGGVQSGGTSKDLNGPTSNLKNSSESGHNTSSPSQIKGKKRERNDQNAESHKRERLSRSECNDVGHFKLESNTRSEEVTKITSKDGSLTSTEAVAQFVHLMQQDQNDDVKKGMELALRRTELVSVLAITERDDCLSQFVQLRGLQILDDWLQEAHKGKCGDAGSPKEGDKVVEDLLLMLLKALDKLPVDLDALKTCNVGKSVNHLRNHKNQEIQKKARNLVDTWKKRVDAEMKNDTKSGSSQGTTVTNNKQGTGDGIQTPVGRRAASLEAIKNSPGNSSSKAISTRCGQPDMLSRSTSIPSGTVTSIKEEKSSSSSQSQNNSHSWSSDPFKAVGTVWKEDARSSTAGSMTVKSSSVGSRHRKSTNGTLGSGKAGAQKEGSGGKMIMVNKSVGDRTIQPSNTSERTVDGTSNHRLIVKLPIPSRISMPSGGTAEDVPTLVSRGSSPIISDKQDVADLKSKSKVDACRTNGITELNTESWQSNEIKDVSTEGDDGDRSSVAIPSEENSRVGEELEKSEISKLASLDSGKEKDQVKSLSLMEEKSCEKAELSGSEIKSSSEVSKAATAEFDEGGMKLLACVATTENFKNVNSEMKVSTEKCFTFTVKKENIEDSIIDDQHAATIDKCLKENNDPTDSKHKQLDATTFKPETAPSTGTFVSHDNVNSSNGQQQPCTGGHSSDGTGKSHSKVGKIKESTNYENGMYQSSGPSEGLHEAANQRASNTNERMDKALNETSEMIENKEDNHTEMSSENGGKTDSKENKSGDLVKLEEACSVSDMVAKNAVDIDYTVKKETIAESEGVYPVKSICDAKSDEREKVTVPVNDTKESRELMEISEETLELCEGIKVDNYQNNQSNDRLGDTMDVNNDMTQKIKQEAAHTEEANQQIGRTSSNGHMEIDDGTSKEFNNIKIQMQGTKEEIKLLSECLAPAQTALPLKPEQREQQQEKDGKVTASLEPVEQEEKVEETENGIQAAELSVSNRKSLTAENEALEKDSSQKLDFDLNEGFSGDDSVQDDLLPSTAIACQVSHAATISDASGLNSSPLAVPIAVAAKSKGPVIPISSILRVSGEPGWRGTAATSAFRPAEPRRTPEKQYGASECLVPNNGHNQTGCGSSCSQGQSRPHLDIDLNVADEGAVEDPTATCVSQISARMTSSELTSVSGHNFVPSSRDLSAPNGSTSTGKLDLDLNKAEDYEDAGQVSSYIEVSNSVVKTFANGFSNGGESQGARGFDLNDGPSSEDVAMEHNPRISSAKGKAHSYVPSLSGWSMNAELLNVSPWLPPGTSHPSLSMHPIPPDRADRTYPMVASSVAQHILSSSSAPAYSGDAYRGPVLASTIAYPNVTQPTFPYGAYSFSSSFPLASNSFSGGISSFRDPIGATCFPPGSSQLVTAGSVSTPGVRPFVMSLTDMSPSEGSCKWSRPVLDLNAGPGVIDVEARDSKQFTVQESWVSPEEQARQIVNATASGVLPLKRKEPEGGWDSHSVGFSQSPWQ